MSDGINLPAHCDTTLTFDVFDEYKRRIGVIDNCEINQLTLEDL